MMGLWIFLGAVALCMLCVAVPVCVRCSRWYRVRTIARYRRDYPRMHTYSVSPTCRMFGHPYFHDDPDDGYRFKAYDMFHAGERYFRMYRRKYKEMSDHEGSASHECKPMWGHLRVKDMDTGYIHYLGQ